VTRPWKEFVLWVVGIALVLIGLDLNFWSEMMFMGGLFLLLGLR
jgi:hypothetical protein